MSRTTCHVYHIIKRLIINRAQYNKVKSQHNITIQQHKMNLAQLIMARCQYNYSMT